MEQKFCEKTAATDLLMGEKYLASMYNTFLLECCTQEMIGCLSELLSDTHNMQQHLFEEMSSLGWYSACKAEDTKVNEAKQKFTQKVTCPTCR